MIDYGNHAEQSYKLFIGAPGGGAFNQQIDMMMMMISCDRDGL